MAKQTIILKEKIRKLGDEGDVVDVKAGFARNFLIPQGKAYEGTKSNLRHVRHLQKVRAKREGEELAVAQDLAQKIGRLRMKLTLETGETGKAFGSITNQDIAAELVSRGEHFADIDRHKIELEKPIKTTGKFEVSVRVHKDIVAVINLAVTTASADVEGEDGQASE